MELTDSLKALFIDTAKILKGSARRVFMTRTVKELGPGGQRRAEHELGWSRVLIRKGTGEFDSGIPIQGQLLRAWPQACRRPSAQATH